MSNSGSSFRFFVVRWIWWFLGGFTLLGSLGGCTYFNAFYSFVDNYELAYKYNRRTGEVSRVGRTGYIWALPILENIHAVDLRPMQVCINANSRVLNCKLVQFNPKGLELFLSWHGRDDYSYYALNPILMSYAYDGSEKEYPFLTVLRELKPSEVVQSEVVSP
jgi:hypothetical protein